MMERWDKYDALVSFIKTLKDNFNKRIDECEASGLDEETIIKGFEQSVKTLDIVLDYSAELENTYEREKGLFNAE